MAKQVETRERYRIHGETTLEQFGYVLAQLTKLGLENVGYELITDVATFKEKKQHDTTGHVFAEEFVKANPTFEIRDLVKHFAADGRNPGSAYAAARLLCETKVLRKLGPGNYQAYAMKSLPSPEDKATEAKRSHKAKPTFTAKVRPLKIKHKRVNLKPHRLYPVSNKDFLLALFKGKTEIDVSVVNDHFIKDGRPVKSAGSLMSQFNTLGYCKPLGGGVWKILAKAQNVKKPLSKLKSQQQQVNGIDVSPEPTTGEEVANG